MTWRRILRRLRAELRLTGLAAWRGLLELLNSNDVTHAAAIAYYALLSLFPFLLLIVSILGSITAGSDAQDEGASARSAVLSFVFQYFPAKIDFVTNQLDGLRDVGTASAAVSWGAWRSSGPRSACSAPSPAL